MNLKLGENNIIRTCKLYLDSFPGSCDPRSSRGHLSSYQLKLSHGLDSLETRWYAIYMHIFEGISRSWRIQLRSLSSQAGDCGSRWSRNQVRRVVREPPRFSKKD